MSAGVSEQPAKPKTCSVCGHLSHVLLGFCPNIASDNDCSCTFAGSDRELETAHLSKRVRQALDSAIAEAVDWDDYKTLSSVFQGAGGQIHDDQTSKELGAALVAVAQYGAQRALMNERDL